jgi:dTDP-4-amino-4,6-dideoxygalactose transaminase
MWKILSGEKQEYDEVLNDRKYKYSIYRDLLGKAKDLRFQEIRDGECNYSYFPVIFPTEEILLKVEKKLNEENIFPRRYFYPSVNTFSKILDYQPTPIAEDISKRILCLPLYWSLDRKQVMRISEQIISALNV